MRLEGMEYAKSNERFLCARGDVGGRMGLRTIGTGLLLVGLAIAIGGGDIPFGYEDIRKQLDLVAGYRNARAMKKEPNMCEQAAYARYVSYWVGGVIAGFGTAILVISLFSGD